MLWLWLLIVTTIPIIPTARHAFAFMRTDMIDNNDYSWDNEDRWYYGLGALALGVIWPITLAWFIVTANPPKTQTEVREQAREHEAQIRRLELENERFQLELDQHKPANGQ